MANIRILAVLLVGGWCSAQQPNVEKIIEALKASESKLKNLYIEGSCNRERRVGEAWVDDGDVQFLAWFDGKPGGRMRFDVPKDRAPWTNGAAPFSTDVYEIGWDGSQTRLLRRDVGQWWTSRPSQLQWPTQFTGWDCTLYGAFGWGRRGKPGVSFSEYVRSYSEIVKKLTARNPQSRAGLTISEKKTNGKVKALAIGFITNPTGSRTEEWQLDPSKGYVPLEQSITYKGGVERSKMTVDELTQPALGVWIPKKITKLRRDSKTGSLTHRTTVMLKYIVANDDLFDYGVFTVEFPPGTHVRKGG